MKYRVSIYTSTEVVEIFFVTLMHSPLLERILIKKKSTVQNFRVKIMFWIKIQKVKHSGFDFRNFTLKGKKGPISYKIINSARVVKAT